MGLKFKEWLYGIKSGKSSSKLMSSVIRPAKPFSPAIKKKNNSISS